MLVCLIACIKAVSPMPTQSQTHPRDKGRSDGSIKGGGMEGGGGRTVLALSQNTEGKESNSGINWCC